MSNNELPSLFFEKTKIINNNKFFLNNLMPGEDGERRDCQGRNQEPKSWLG
jgi:hypothetical protein